jgi:ubiquinone/menaquinone biosynthesis C-methylase UbiE
MIEIRKTAKGTSHTRESYDALYSKQSVTQHWDSFFEWIMRRLNPRPNTRILDACCGTGIALKFANRANGMRNFGFDFSVVALREAKALGHVAASDAEFLPFADKSFDYVINLGSLEHLENMAVSTREMSRVLTVDGVCCILVPNTFGLMWTVRHALTHGEIFDDGQPLQRYGTFREWSTLLADNGLVIRRTLGYETHRPQTRWQWAHYLRHPKMNLSKLLLAPFIPVNLASMFVFFCGRAR